ncbi:MAG TPA: phosphonate ABC transporter, permease protein PhnE [Candidatus Sulfomarinibacteraceae bacterium]|nr:phosphonate ABC transporter, permease protein PhnE [Candidatus Sulfomarinibacteraceae bacterium]
MQDNTSDDTVQRSSIPAWQAALASLVIPGSGQILAGHRGLGLTLLGSIVFLAALVLWLGLPVLLVPIAGIWLWNAWHAYKLAGGHEARWTIALVLGALVVYALAFDAVDVRTDRLISGLPTMRPYLSALADPALFTRETEDLVGLEPIMVPCVEPLPPPARNPTQEPDVILDAECAEVGDIITVRGEGFFPNHEGELRWVNPLGDTQRLLFEGELVTFETDDEGRFEVQVRAPQAVPLTQLPPEGETLTHAIRAEQHRPFGPLIPTQTLELVIEKIGETIALAFISTVMGVLFAVPLSFLAARNLMGANPITRGIYYVMRTLMNVVRSIETLMWAIIFAVWVGLGPFAGSLALWLHTVAALGKLYSEAIESIDPGPIEAIRATGANWPQMVVYAVFPQILPTFTSFTLYRWDINVRLSTVIGLVSDAGLGFLVIQWIRLNRFSSMATAIIAIVIVVATLDYVSGWVRERIIAGTPVVKQASPLRRNVVRIAIVGGFLVLFIWSWNVAEIELDELVDGAPAGLRIARAFAVPDFFDRPEEELVLSHPLPVPCGAAEAVTGEVHSDLADATLDLEPACGEVGDELLIQASGLPPNSDVSVRWQFPDGAFLRIRSDCCVTDSDGNLLMETEINRIILAGIPEDSDEPVRVAIVWREAVGPLQLSASFHRVVDLSVVTLLMALMATTLGSLFAVPLSFFAARNVMGNSVLGRTVYYIFRTTFNITRSVEPLILVLIAAAWVGVGPFAGMLALTLNNIPNLGKLFSETIEEIDPGPVEAIRATGANSLQVLVFGYLPQLVPRFLAFILYQWDINIRMSTVIGFVGGGGIGQQFRIWVGLNQYSAAGMATWAIVAMVWSMDYLSARAREEMV